MIKQYKRELSCCAFHTGNPNSSSCGLVNITGLGQRQDLNTKKNFRNKLAGHAFGYSCSTNATAMLIFTPPQYPILFEYNPLLLAHLRTNRTTVRNV